jgi:hypothetical protein
VGQPPSIQVPGSQKSVTISGVSLGLLGDSLGFSVQGMLASGLTGNPASDRSCTQAWRPPNPADIQLSDAGTPSPNGTSITATLQVSTKGASEVDAFGSQTTEFVYVVGAQVVGPTTSRRVTVPGLAGGTPYTPTVRVYPAGHPGASTIVIGTPFTQNLAWPPALSVTAAGNPNPSSPNSGTVVLTFHALPAGPMTASGGPIVCGSTQTTSAPTGQISNGTLAVPMPDLVDAGGNCSLSVTVSDLANPNPYGVPSRTLNAAFIIAGQPGYTFKDRISPACQATFCSPEQIEVDFTGSRLEPLQAGGDWVIAPTCGPPVALSAPPRFPIIITLADTCSDATAVDVLVKYKYLGTTITLDAGAPSGTPATTTTTTTTTSTTSTTSTTTPTSTTTQPTSSIPLSTVSPTQLAASRSARPLTLTSVVHGDAQVRAGLQWAGVAAGVAWCGRVVLRARRRRQSRRGQS